MTQRYHVFAMHFVGTSAFEVVNNAVNKNVKVSAVSPFYFISSITIKKSLIKDKNFRVS